MFLVFGLWGWLAVVVIVGLMLAAEALENGYFSLVVFAAAVALLQWVGDVPVFSYLRDNSPTVLAAMALYVVLGVIWSAFKWYLYAVDTAEEYAERKERFWEEDKVWREEFKDRNYRLMGEETPEVSVEQRWKNRNASRNGALSFPPKVTEHKAKITRWMACWVSSVIWTLCHDFVKRMYRRIVQLVSGTFQKISDKVFAKFKADFQ